MSKNHPHDNIYSILGKLEALKPTPEEKRFALVKEIRESVEAQGSILEGVDAVQSRLSQQFAEAKKAKPDYIDLDKDGDKKEPMKKAAKEKIEEKAVSQAQQKFMGMVHAAQKGEKPASPEVAKVAKDMGKKDARDFAATKHKGLPQHVEEATCNECGMYESKCSCPTTNEGIEFPNNWQRGMTDDMVQKMFYDFAKQVATQYGLHDKSPVQQIAALALQVAMSSGDRSEASAKFKRLFKKYFDQGMFEGEVKKITGKTNYTGQDLVKDANRLFTAGGFKLADKQVEPRQDDPKKISTTYFWRKKVPGLGVQELMIEIYNYAPGRTYYAVNDYSKDGAKVAPGLAQKMWIEMQFQIDDMSSQAGISEGEVKKIAGGIRHTKTDYPGYPTDDTLDNIDNLKGPGGGVRKGRPLKAQTKNPRRDPNAPKKGRGRPATAKSGPVSMPADPFGRTTGKVPKGRKGTVHTVDEAMRLVARSLTESMNFKRMIDEQHMTLDEMVECMNADMQVFKETGVCSDRLRDMMEVYSHAKRQADEGIEQPQHGGIGDVMTPAEKANKMMRVTPHAPGLKGSIASAIHGGKAMAQKALGVSPIIQEPIDEEQLALEAELNELAKLAGLNTEGVDKVKFASLAEPKDKITYADKIAGAKLHDKTDEEIEQEGNLYGQNVLQAKAAGKKQADLDGDGDLDPVKEAQELVAMLKVAGIDTEQLEEAIEQATQVRGIPVHKPVTPPVTDFSNDNDEEGEVCPNCDGAGCEECHGDEHRDHAHAHVQGMERESAGMSEGFGMSEVDELYQEWVNSEYAPHDSDSGDTNAVTSKAEQFLRGKVNPAHIEDIADMLSNYWHGGQGVMGEEYANEPEEKYDTIDATMRPGDADATGAHRNFGGPGDNPMAQPPNVPAKPVRSVKEAILALESELAAEYESIKKASK